MSICRGIAGNRGRNPKGIFIHNDAGSKYATAEFYTGYLQGANLDNGFAHLYVASDGTLQAEDDGNCAWHCGQTDGNTNYLSIEICQSMGDLNTFLANEDRALRLAAEKCKLYGITPNENTIRLHKEVFATACPHRSVEVHGGDTATKSYFIEKIKEYMSASGQWIKDNIGWWYKKSDGGYYKNQWLKLDAWYFFKGDGYAASGWAALGGHVYYFDSNCRMQTGWKHIDGKWYYLNPKESKGHPEGSMLEGWQLINGHWYCLTTSDTKDSKHPIGSMRTGFYDDGNYTYYLTEHGTHLNPEGSMVKGWQFINNRWYYFNENKNCQPVGSMMKNHWTELNGKRYYLKDDGAMACGETMKISGKTHVFNGSGEMIK